MALKVSAPDGVKVYNVSSGKTLPQWLSESKQKSLKKNEDYRRRLELIQDYAFPAACQRIKITPDQQYVFATGYHPPQVRVYDLANLSMKFMRHLDAEIVDFQVLTEDYSKVAFLCTDRSVCFHARFGAYYKTRVPKAGRDIAYAQNLAEVLVTGSAPEVYRINLVEGRFMSPLSARSPGINASGIASVHGLFACAGEDGMLECFDLRQRQPVGFLDAAAASGAPGEELTALRFDDTGLHIGVGTKNGLVSVFDLRSQRPLVVKDHMYGSPIIDIKFPAGFGDTSSTRRVISSDKHIVKIWDMNTGKGYTSVEPAEGNINDVCVWPNSGLLMVACDTPSIQNYFIPSLGPAPWWCSFLEGLTEELEEQAPTVYDDYRFVTKADLVKLGLDHLMGTPMLRAYMHGFFIDNRLYNKAKEMMDPFAYETYRQQRIQKKLDEERRSRISIVKKLPKVNAKVAAKIMAAQVEAGAEGAVKKGDVIADPMADDRFKAMFEDPDFMVDEDADDYKLLHPNASKDKRKDEQMLQEHFDQVSDQEEEEEDGIRSSDEGSLDEMGEAPAEQLRQKFAAKKKAEQERQAAKAGKRMGNRTADGKQGSKLGIAEGRVHKKPAMYVARDEAAAAAFRNRESMADVMSQPLAERLASQPQTGTSGRVGGSRELTFCVGIRGRGRGRGHGGEASGGEDGFSRGSYRRGHSSKNGMDDVLGNGARGRGKGGRRGRGGGRGFKRGSGRGGGRRGR